MPTEAMARGVSRLSRRVGQGVFSLGRAPRTFDSAPTLSFETEFARHRVFGAPRWYSTSGATPLFSGAFCERVDVELGTSKTLATVGFETGRVARLANGAVIASLGDTVAMCAVTTARQPDPDATFFPLQVDYRERASAYGKIPSTFTRREGPPKDREVLAMRVVDRTLRPLFPKGFKNETSLQVVVLSSDRCQDPAVLAVNGASCALMISDIPWNGPAGAARVAVSDDFEIIKNPSDADCESSRFVLTYAGTADRTLMIEAAAMKHGGVPEAIVALALRTAHELAKEIIEPQLRLQAAVGRPKREMDALDEAVKKVIHAAFLCSASSRLHALYAEEIQSKSGRGKKMAELKDSVFAELSASDDVKSKITEIIAEDVNADSLDSAIRKYLKHHADGAYLHACSSVMRTRIFDTGKRIDGRGVDELRELVSVADVLPVTHGSSIFERGNTQTLATATIGSLNDVQRLDAPVGPENKRLMLHYAFPSFSIDETPRRGGLSRREIGHGALAEKALAAALPSSDAWPFAVRLNAETMESNGSSSMAAVCAGSMALMAAGVPIEDHVGAISVGLVMDEDEFGKVTRHKILADIMGLEDVLGDMDFKIAGTRTGVTAIQLDCKPAGIPIDILVEALLVASTARGLVIDSMCAAIPRARRADLGEVSESSPRFTSMAIDVSLIGKLIGTGGKTIKEIQQTTGATVSVDQPKIGPNSARAGVHMSVGKVGIFAPNKASLDLAVERVAAIVTPLAAGEVVRATVIDVKPFGWILRTAGMDEGMLHVTEYQWDTTRIETTEFLPIGETLEVKGYEPPPIRSPSFGGMRPKTPLGRGAGKSAGRGIGGGGPGSSGGLLTQERTTGGFVRNLDGTLKRPLERVGGGEKSGGDGE